VNKGTLAVVGTESDTVAVELGTTTLADGTTLAVGSNGTLTVDSVAVTGENSPTATVALDGGTLKGSSALSLASNIGVTIADNTTGTIDTANGTVTVAGSVTGDTLAKVGSNDLVLGGENIESDLDALTVDEGSVKLNGGSLTAETLTIATDATTEVAAGTLAVGEVAYDATDNAGSIKLSGGTLASAVVATDDGTIAPLEISNAVSLAKGTSSTITTDHGDITIAGVVTSETADGSTAGALTKAGANTLTLSGAGSSIASVEVDAGTLAVANQVTITDMTLKGGTLASAVVKGDDEDKTPALTLTSNVEIASVADDGKSAIDTTNGDITISGEVTGTGTLDVKGGNTLTLNSLAASDATLNLDATTLVTTGSATLGTLNLANGSTVQIDGAKADSFGTLNLTNLTSDAKSTFLIDLGANNASDKLVVSNYDGTGSVYLTLNNATLAGTYTVFEGNTTSLTSLDNINISVDLARGLWIDQSTGDTAGIKVNEGLVTVTIQGKTGDPLNLT
jgi:autotransporter-associated beta strand protein